MLFKGLAVSARFEKLPFGKAWLAADDLFKALALKTCLKGLAIDNLFKAPALKIPFERPGYGKPVRSAGFENFF